MNSERVQCFGRQCFLYIRKCPEKKSRCKFRLLSNATIIIQCQNVVFEEKAR